MKRPEIEPMFVVFDGPPGPKAPGFIEVETSAGFSVKAGEWRPYGDYWTLGPLVTLSDAQQAIKDAYERGKKDAMPENEVLRNHLEDSKDMVAIALRKAWQLGQIYWQQADSESYAQQDRSAGTQDRFANLVETTCSELTAPKQEKNDEPV